MIQKELIDQLVAFVEKAPLSFIGKHIHIQQDLSLVKDNFDRHFSATSTFSFLLTEFMVRFSGNVLMFMGEKTSARNPLRQAH